MTQKNISQYHQTESDSISLTKIDGQKFTIVKVDDSDYEDKGKKSRGVKITTQEDFKVDGIPHNRFHTTRMLVVGKLGHIDEEGKPMNVGLHADLERGDTIGPMICKEIIAKKGGTNYFDLVEA